MHTIWPIHKIDLLPLAEIKGNRPVALITSGPAWRAVEGKLNLPVSWKTEVFEATTELGTT